MSKRIIGLENRSLMQVQSDMQCKYILLQSIVCRQYAKSSSCAAALYFHFVLATLLKLSFAYAGQAAKTAAGVYQCAA